MNEKDSWIKYIKGRIKDNKNFLAITTGPTGSGKSWASLAIAEQLEENFNINQVVFRALDLMKLINSGVLKPGSVIVFDEAQIDLNARNWQNLINKVLNYLISTFRHQNFILLFTSPYSDFVDSATMKLFHANFETTGINKETQEVYIKPKLLQYNQNMKKWYHKYLKWRTSSGVIKIKKWKINKPSAKLIDEYETAKKKFTGLLNQEIQNKLQKKIDEENQTNQKQEDLKAGIRLPLTPTQEAVMKTLAYHKWADASKILGISYPAIALNKSLAEKKGYLVDEFREKEDQILQIYKKKVEEIPFLRV